jgi:hypothetical protein
VQGQIYLPLILTLRPYPLRIKYQYCRILLSTVCTFSTLNDAEIFPAHYTWKIAEKGLKMAFMMNKPAMIKSCEIILEK